MQKKHLVILYLFAVVVFLATPVQAGIASELIKWQQRPDMVHGANIVSAMMPRQDTVADDWLCLDGSPITGIRFWGSYPDWMSEKPRPDPSAVPGVKGFGIRIFADVPADATGNYSHPGRLLYAAKLDEFTETYEASILLPIQQYEHKFRYELKLPHPFRQHRDTIYWLNIIAYPKMENYPWGWETSMDRWNDFAVHGWYDNNEWWWMTVSHPYLEGQVDMAFELITEEGPIKWLQFPDMAEGENIVSFPMDPVVADDFLCRDGKPIIEVQFWGSYLTRDAKQHWEMYNPGPPFSFLPHPPPLDSFKLSFHEDIPAGFDREMPWSHPGELLLEIRVPSKQVEVRYWDSIPHEGPAGTAVWWEHKFLYKIALEKPFRQKQGVIYWLDIGAVPAPDSLWVWGWETSKDHWNDNAVAGYKEGSWWKMLGSKVIDFEDLTLGSVYHVGDTFHSVAADITGRPFQLPDGTWTSKGSATVTDAGMAGGAGGSGNEINLNNINLAFDFCCKPLPGLVMLFGEYGGNLNIDINGDFRNFKNFADIDGTIIGGVAVSVVGGTGQDKGILTLTGAINTFSVGGQELYIDNISFDCKLDMAFALITDRCANPCADFDSSSIVDILDLRTFAEDWLWTGLPGGYNIRDLNCDGRVDLEDFVVVARQWLGGCP